jgi:hypothetical protein
MYDEKVPNVEIRIIRNKSEYILPLFTPGQFDLVYIDGNHSFQNVDFDISQARRLVKERRILCRDDLELQMDECDAEYGEKHLDVDFLEDLKTGIYYHPGVTFAVWKHFERVKSYCGFCALKKEKTLEQC